MPTSSRAGLVVSFLLTAACASKSAQAQSCVPGWSGASTGLEASGWRLPVVLSFARFDADGEYAGPTELYAAGAFSTGSPAVRGVARWSNGRWAPLSAGLSGGPGLPVVYALKVYDDDDAGPRRAGLYAAGSFAFAGPTRAANIARWDGTSWSRVGTLPSNLITCLEVYDTDGAGPERPLLVAGGNFRTSAGGPVNGVAAWDGSSWTRLGVVPNSIVRALRAFDPDGNGPGRPRLFMASDAGLSHWDGFQWNIDLSFRGRDLEVVDPDGAGPNPGTLFAAAGFGMYRWEGSAWEPMTFNFPALTLDTYDEDGAGPLPPLLVASSGTQIAFWTGVLWSSLASTTVIPGDLFAMTSFDTDGAGPAPTSLFVGGEILEVDQVPAHGAAKWACQAAPRLCPGDMDADQSVDMGDLLLVLTNWGATGVVLGDADGDRSVDMGDLTFVLGLWGDACRPGTAPAFSSAQFQVGDTDGNGQMEFEDVTRFLSNTGASRY